MKKIVIILLILIANTPSIAQKIPNDAKMIIVKGVSFQQVCNALLDSGYSIDKKDNDLQTVRTEVKDFEKLWNGSYVINVRVKDSVAYVSGTLTAPGRVGGLFRNEPITAIVNKDGELKKKSLFGYAFSVLQEFAFYLGKEINYLK